MAKRYSGDLQINVVYDDRNYYQTSISRDGRVLWRGRVHPAPAGFGRGVAYDSPQAYDEIARSAIAFGANDVDGLADTAEIGESDYIVRRVPRFHQQWPPGQVRPKRFATRDRDETMYQIVWVRDDRGTRGVLAPGPFTRREAQTVLRKQMRYPGRRVVIEPISRRDSRRR